VLAQEDHLGKQNVLFCPIRGPKDVLRVIYGVTAGISHWGPDAIIWGIFSGEVSG